MNKQTPEMILYWQLKLYRMTQGTQKNKREIVIVLIFLFEWMKPLPFPLEERITEKKTNE